jgi:hypothetical protein
MAKHQNKQVQQIDPESLDTYFQQRMYALGVLDTSKYGFDHESTEYNGVKTFYPYFAEAKNGDIQINYPCLYGGAEMIDDTETLFCRRRINPARQTDDDRKYFQDAKSGVHIFFPPGILKKFDKKTKIKTLYAIEGEFKAFAGDMAGIDIIGLGGKDLFKDKDGDLHADIQRILQVCEVENFVLLLDADLFHLTWNIVDDPHKDLAKRQYSFYGTVVNFRELTKGKVRDTYFMHIKAEFLDKAKGLDDLLQINRGKEKKIVADLLKLKTANEYFDGRNLSTTSTTALKKYFLLEYHKNVPYDFYERFEKIIGNELFNFSGGRYQKKDKEELKLIKHEDSSKYVRVGCDYLKIIKVPNSKGILEVRRTPWKKGEITMDYVQKGHNNFYDTIEKYDAFCNVPNNTPSYQPVISDCFNLYYKLEHVPVEGEWPNIEKYLKHVFGEKKLLGGETTNYDLILDCIQLKYLEPTQMLPICCLVSKERNTGKSSFLWFLRDIFQENATVLGNQEINSEFNDDWASKAVIGIDEGFIDKKTTLEKIKSQSTNNKIKLRAMHTGRQDVSFFGWFVITSNDEDNFIPIDEEEIRFWVNKVGKYTEEDPHLLKKMKEEIPAFLYYLRNRKLVHPESGRMWFSEKLVETDALKKIKQNNRGWFVGELTELIKDEFFARQYHTIYFTNSELFEMLNGGNAAARFRKGDINKQMEQRFGMVTKNGRYHQPNVVDVDNYDPLKQRFHEKQGRCYEFRVEDWLPENVIKDEMPDYFDFNKIKAERSEGLTKNKNNDPFA